ncbi:MAG: hypothetical protein WC556_00260 [Candidatus Methanoperedens sp.]
MSFICGMILEGFFNQLQQLSNNPTDQQQAIPGEGARTHRRCGLLRRNMGKSTGRLR